MGTRSAHALPLAVAAALAAGSYAGIPVTHRGIASAVALVTGHEEPGKNQSALDWDALAKFPGTLVIYMGDNGFSWGEHGLIDKRHFYEESVKVPLLVRCPELFEGGLKPKAMVQNIDIGPTILAEAGVEKPKNMPGVSFIPALTGEPGAKVREEVFYEYFWEYDFPMTPTVFGMRTEKYKYMKYQGIWDRNELYDLENDPEEMYNLIAEPDKQEIVKSMSTDIYNWLEQTNGMQIPLKQTIKYRFGDYKHEGEY